MITSRHHAIVLEIRALNRKREGDRFVAEGPRVVVEALRAGLATDYVAVSPRADEALLASVRERGIRVVEVAPEIMEYAADSQHSQGILAVARTPEPLEPAPGGVVVILDEVRDPGNLGTIARTCRAAGVSALLLSGATVDPWSPKVVRASAGAIFTLPPRRLARPEDVVDWLDERGLPLVGASATAPLRCDQAELRPPLALVLGNETRGIGPVLARRCRQTVRVPMVPGVESLNLAAAAAVVIYAVPLPGRT